MSDCTIVDGEEDELAAALRLERTADVSRGPGIVERFFTGGDVAFVEVDGEHVGYGGTVKRTGHVFLKEEYRSPEVLDELADHLELRKLIVLDGNDWLAEIAEQDGFEMAERINIPEYTTGSLFVRLDERP